VGLGSKGLSILAAFVERRVVIKPDTLVPDCAVGSRVDVSLGRCRPKTSGPHNRKDGPDELGTLLDERERGSEHYDGRKARQGSRYVSGILLAVGNRPGVHCTCGIVIT